MDIGGRIGRVGVWTYHLELLPATRSQELAQELESLGFGAVWVSEAVGREALINAGLLLAGTNEIVVATGVASIWSRDPMAMSAAHLGLSEAYPDRFVLGMGVSHASMVSGVRGHDYRRPLSQMSSYLDAMDTALYLGARPTNPPTRVLGALGPKMLGLAAEKAAGAHPYFVPVEHTAMAREVLGAEPLLAPEQAVVLETAPDVARQIGRGHLSLYLKLENYTGNLRRFGFDDDDFADGGSDRLVDALVAWGSLDDVAARVQAHHDAGADHVCLQVLDADPMNPPLRQWRELAEALIG